MAFYFNIKNRLNHIIVSATAIFIDIEHLKRLVFILKKKIVIGKFNHKTLRH